MKRRTWIKHILTLSAAFAMSACGPDTGAGPTGGQGNGGNGNNGGAGENNTGTFQLASDSITSGGVIADRYTFDYGNTSPELHWSNAPSGTKSYAVIVDDTDANGFVHWGVFNIKNTVNQIAEGASTDINAMPMDCQEGLSDFGGEGYEGPEPPDGETHTYTFTIYAVNVAEYAVPGNDAYHRQTFERDFAGKILGKASFTASYTQH